MNQSIFSKEKRLSIYRKAYELYQSKNHNPNAENEYRIFGKRACLGLCSVMTEAMSMHDVRSYHLTKQNFPEFFSYKPKTGWKKNHRFWWTLSDKKGGTAKRMDVLHRLSRGMSKGDTF